MSIKNPDKNEAEGTRAKVFRQYTPGFEYITSHLNQAQISQNPPRKLTTAKITIAFTKRVDH